MRDFAKISTSIWRSKKFKRVKNTDAQLLYFYLHTCPHVNSLGCFVLPFGYALADLGWNNMDTDPIRYRNCIAELCEVGLIGFDEAESVVRIVDFLEHSPFSNPKHATGAVRILYHLPDCDEKTSLINDLRGKKHVSEAILADFMNRVSDTVSKPFRYTETETETERETYIGGGGSACAREDETPIEGMKPPVPDEPTFRERLLIAAGIDPMSITRFGPGAVGGTIDMGEARRWVTDLNFTEDEAVQHVADIRAGMDQSPGSLRYFTKPLQRIAGAKAAPALQPETSKESHDRTTARDRRTAAADDAFEERIAFAARNRSPSRSDFGFG